MGAMRNHRYVLDQADTEYFMWHAFDDHVAPNYLEALLSVMSNDPRCSLACGVAVHERPDGSQIRRVEAPVMASKSRLSRVRSSLESPGITWIRGLFRTEALRRIRPMAEDFCYAGANDTLTVLPFILNDEIPGCRDTTFYYRLTDRSRKSYRPDTTAAKANRFARAVGTKPKASVKGQG